MINQKILVVDDESKIRLIIQRLLESRHYEVRTAAGGNEALALLPVFKPDLVLLDLKMPERDGMDTFQEMIRRQFTGKVIFLTAFGSIPSAVEAMRVGAYDYLTKPFANDELIQTVRRALEGEVPPSAEKRAAAQGERFRFSAIISADRVVKGLIDRVLRIAPTETPVLIIGESGTGKELFARAVHESSRRAQKPFIALNCSAIPAHLIESELFGYRKGAFSGADRTKPGLVEQADGGTLFLDEVAEMGAEAQAKLLRFTQSGEFFQLGDTQPRRVNARIIAATNKNLDEEVALGSFRSDLYYRLNVVQLVIPPLRERPGDIALLIDHFLARYAVQLGRQDYHFDEAARAALCRYYWPGNVRELENAVRSALLMADAPIIGIEQLPESIRSEVRSAGADSLQGKRAEGERQAIIDALEACGGNRTHAAERLGISRNTMLRKLNKLGIR